MKDKHKAARFAMYLLFCLLFPMILLASEGSIPIVHPWNGRVVCHYPIRSDGFTVLDVETKVKYAAGSFKFSYTPIGATFYQSDVRSYSWVDTQFIEGFWVNDTDRYAFQWKIYPKNGQLEVVLMPSGKSWDLMHIQWEFPEGLSWFGAGEQFSHIRLNGHVVPIWSEEQGVGRGDMPISRLTNRLGVAGDAFSTYFSMPWLLSHEGRGFFMHGMGRQWVDLTQEGRIQWTTTEGNFHFTIFQAGSTLEVLELFTSQTGRMPKPATFVSGTWLGMQGGWNRILPILSEAQRFGNPVSAIWIQDWVGRRKTIIGSRLWWTWKPDEKRYPRMKEVIDSLYRQHIKVLGYVNPYLARRSFYAKEAQKKDFLIRKDNGKIFVMKAGGFRAFIVDLSRPEAFRWFQNVIQEEMLARGFSGWMADFSEGLPWNVKYGENLEPGTAHHRFIQDWIRLNAEVIEAADSSKEWLFFNRAGFSHTNHWSRMYWAGDQMVNAGRHDGFPSALRAQISTGLSGAVFNHADIGGYTNVHFLKHRHHRSADLWALWTDLAVYGPVMRTHEGLQPKRNHQFYSDSSSQAYFAKAGRMHLLFQPYFTHCFEESSRRGYPFWRALWLHFPEDPRTHVIEDQFLIGDAWLVCPFTDPEQKERTCYLPKGLWRNVWRGETIEGPAEIKVRRKPHQVPLFVSADDPRIETWKPLFQSLREE